MRAGSIHGSTTYAFERLPSHCVVLHRSSGACPSISTFWRGFFELAPAAEKVSRLTDLSGKNVLVSGPVGDGRAAGPNILFKAAIKRQATIPPDMMMTQPMWALAAQNCQ